MIIAFVILWTLGVDVVDWPDGGDMSPGRPYSALCDLALSSQCPGDRSGVLSST